MVSNTEVNKFLNKVANRDLITVKVKPRAKRTEILSLDKKKKEIKAAVKSAPEKGKANLELVKLLSRISGRFVSIKKGLKSKKKVIEVSS